MKRIFAFVLVLVICFSLCACNMPKQSHVDVDGNIIDDIKNDDIVFEKTTEFTVTKMQVVGTSHKINVTYYGYLMAFTDGEYSYLCEAEDREYALFDVGSTIRGTVKSVYDSGVLDKEITTFYYDNVELPIKWYGKISE